MTEWERGRERDEFVRAALLYKPSNSSLSSRFTRSKQEDDTDKVEVTRDQEVRSFTFQVHLVKMELKRCLYLQYCPLLGNLILL